MSAEIILGIDFSSKYVKADWKYDVAYAKRKAADEFLIDEETEMKIILEVHYYMKREFLKPESNPLHLHHIRPDKDSA